MGEIIKKSQKIEGAAQFKSSFSKGKLATGFTLIELMMVLAMIAIFMALAIPSYQEYVRRADASMVQQEMQKIAEQLESGVIVAIICDRGDRYLSSDLFD